MEKTIGLDGLQDHLQGKNPFVSLQLLVHSTWYGLTSPAPLPRAAPPPPPPRYITLPTPAAAPPFQSPPLGSASSFINQDRPQSGGSLEALREGFERMTTGAPPLPYRPEAVLPNSAAALAAPRVGRIKVLIDQDGSEPKVRYVRRSMNWFGFFKYTKKTSDALHVQYTPSSQPSNFKMLVSCTIISVAESGSS